MVAKKMIIEVALTKMSNEVHVEFNEGTDSLIVKSNMEIESIVPLYTLYRGALDNENAALDFIRQSDLTDKVKVQDNVRIRIYKGFSNVILGYTDHYDATICEDAKRLWNVVKFYGSIRKKTPDARSSAMNDFLTEMKSPENAAVLTRLKLEGWTAKMMDENVKYRSIMTDRYNEPSTKTKYRMKTARVETDKYYRAIVAEIENIILKGEATPELMKLIDAHNALITRYKSTLAQVQTKKIEKKIVKHTVNSDTNK